MSGPDKDELARLLGQMAAGGHQEEDGEAGSAGVENHPETTPETPPEPVANTPQTPRNPPAKTPVSLGKQHLVQGLEFKRTLIPVLLTLGVICPAVGVMGFVVGPMSPFVKLREGRFSIPFLAIGLVMLGLGVVTMLQVREGKKRHEGT
jgi:hypothetical protein